MLTAVAFNRKQAAVIGENMVYFTAQRGKKKRRDKYVRHTHARVPVVHLDLERRAQRDDLLDAQAAVPDKQQLDLSGHCRRPNISHL